MSTLQQVALIFHTVVAVLLIVLVLLQRGKGADAGAAFGAGASGTVFGARGSASFFSRATAVLATVFFATSLGLAYLSTQRTTTAGSLMEGVGAESVETGSADAALPAGDDDLPLPDVDDAAEAVEDSVEEALPDVDAPAAGPEEADATDE